MGVANVAVPQALGTGWPDFRATATQSVNQQQPTMMMLPHTHSAQAYRGAAGERSVHE
jgi:hypothetical protein